MASEDGQSAKPEPGCTRVEARSRDQDSRALGSEPLQRGNEKHGCSAADGESKTNGHEHGTEVLVIVEEAAAVESGAKNADKAQNAGPEQ